MPVILPGIRNAPTTSEPPCLISVCRILVLCLTPTSTFPRSGSVIDLAVCSHPSLVSDLRPDPVIPLLSDHLPVRIAFQRSSVFADSPAITHHRRAFEKANWPGYRASLSSSFQSVLNEVNHTTDQSISPKDSCSIALTVITNALTVAADSNIPTTVVGPHRKHWWSVIPGIPAALPNFAVRTAARPATNPLLSVTLGLEPVQNGKT